KRLRACAAVSGGLFGGAAGAGGGERGYDLDRPALRSQQRQWRLHVAATRNYARRQRIHSGGDPERQRRTHAISVGRHAHGSLSHLKPRLLLLLLLLLRRRRPFADLRVGCRAYGPPRATLLSLGHLGQEKSWRGLALQATARNG